MAAARADDRLRRSLGAQNHLYDLGIAILFSDFDSKSSKIYLLATKVNVRFIHWSRIV